jgi:hypothetical protein
MTKAISLLILAAGLAGCGATPKEYRNEKELPLPPGEGAFGSSMTWEWRKKDDSPAQPSAATAPAAAATVSEQEEFKKWRESASRNERQEFEEWRAWQEWKKKNPK